MRLLLDTRKIKPGMMVCIDSTLNMLSGCDEIAVVVENPSKNDMLDIPQQRQVLVREKGKRKGRVIDAATIRKVVTV